MKNVPLVQGTVQVNQPDASLLAYAKDPMVVMVLVIAIVGAAIVGVVYLCMKTISKLVTDLSRRSLK